MKAKYIRMLSSFVLLLSFSVYAEPVLETVLTQWVAPAEREDNTPLNNDLAGFNLYYGVSSGVYTSKVRIDNPEITNYTLYLEYGMYYIVVTAYDTDGRESMYSREVVINLPPLEENKDFNGSFTFTGMLIFLSLLIRRIRNESKS